MMKQKKGKRNTWLKTTLIVVGCLVLVPVVLTVAILAALSIPSVQNKAAQTAARMISERTGVEASVGHFSVRPPFDILLHDVFAGDSIGDTLAYIGTLDARIRIDALPDSIAVKSLKTNNVVAHTGDFISSLKIDGNIGSLSAGIETFSLSEERFRITDASIKDADVSLVLNDSKEDEEESSSDTTALSIDLEGVSLDNVRFSLEPIALKLDVGKAEASALIDVGADCYTVRHIDIADSDFVMDNLGFAIGRLSAEAKADVGNDCYAVRNMDVADTDFGVGDFKITVGGLSGDALVDLKNSVVSSDGLNVNIPDLQADVRLHETYFDMDKMRVTAKAAGSLVGSDFSLDADYDINDELFNVGLDFGRMDLAPVLRMPGSELIVAGHVRASGFGFNPMDEKMTADITADLDICRFDSLDISGLNLAANIKSGALKGTLTTPVHYSDTSVAAKLIMDSRFFVNGFTGKSPGIDFAAKLASVEVRLPDDTLNVSGMDVNLKTMKELCDVNVKMPGMELSANVSAHAFEIPSLLPSSVEINDLADFDTLIAALPAVNADLEIRHDNPLRGVIRKTGFDLTDLTAALHFDGASRKVNVSLKTPDLDGEYRLPAMNAALYANISDGKADATFKFNADVEDGLLSVNGIDTDVSLQTVLKRNGDDMKVDGDLNLADLVYDGKNIGDRKMIFNLRPDSSNPSRSVATANLDDIPVEIVKQFVELPEDIGIYGKVRARAVVKGIPDKIDFFVGVTPIDAAVEYSPYDVLLRLGEQEITLENDKIRLNGITVIGVDSTSVSLDGGLDLDAMTLDVTLKSDGFEPVRLPKDGPMPVYGRLLAGIDGSITGPVDDLLADVDINVLPQTDITYPIDKKNLAQVSPAGTVNVQYGGAAGLQLGGQLDITDGKVFFSPRLYPMMPFVIDKGSHIKFNGGIENTELAVSASQGAKAIYKPHDQVSRNVDFVTSVKVGGSLDKIDIGFFLDAPKDSEIQRELAETPEEDREGLAAVLLATGMYASESNEATQMEGYALSSILQSKLNAASSNRFGNKISLDFGMAKAKHEKGIETTDYTLNVSKSFFKDRLNVKLGGSVSDNAEVNKNSTSFINNISAECKIDSAGMFKARLFSMKDYNNIVEGELIKSGVGVLFNKTLDRRRDSMDRSLDMEVEGNAVLRSNNQFGPDATVSLTKHNLFSRNDIFTVKLKGAYYWNLNRKQLKDPTRNDTYLFGADFTLSFPYMQVGRWARKYDGQTVYRLGYLNENISGDYGIHKLYGGVDYSIRNGRFVTHSFSPLYVSIVLADRASEQLAANVGFVDLLKLFINNEFIPSVRYSFDYNNYRDRSRAVNTALEIQLKESANLISGVTAAFGRDFNEKNKGLLGINYDQFVKLQVELRNKFRLNDRLELATRALTGIVVSFGNSVSAPLSESFSIGGPNSIRAFMPRSIGPGDFHNENYSSYIFHTGDLKLELNAELRFPIVWKLNGAFFFDAGNVWALRDPHDYLSEEGIKALLKGFNLPALYNCSIKAETFLNQIALGTGVGLRLDYESIVIRLDLGIAIHAPFDTGRSGYYNIPKLWRDGMTLNFGIGYPF